MTTKELARYLGINEKKIYTLITEKDLPGTKITGKWIFVKELVDIWIEKSMENHPNRLERLHGILMLTGSNDLLLELMVDELKKEMPDLYPYVSYTGSSKGIEILLHNKAHLSGCHLFGKEGAFQKNSNLYEIPLIFVNFAYREQGLIVQKGNPLGINKIEDITKSGVKFINRQKGSGTRILFDTYLKKYGIPTEDVDGYENEVMTHFEVGMNIVKGVATTGFGIKAIATLLGLSFIPLTWERFDIIIPKHYFFLKEMQIFLDMIRSEQFKQKALSLDGYDPKDAGKIVYTT